ncbi:unnamed protein product [Orchesella dallaii]|uniref:Gustatory receptor n=1 Tax=Orchesella dallaii TaxID=48710 RepID=A0ABP1QDE3_9HEXA
MAKSKLFTSSSEDLFTCIDRTVVQQFRHVSRNKRFNLEDETKQNSPQNETLEGYNIFYFEPFLKTIYYFGLIPYLPERQGDIVIFKKNRIQQVVFICIMAGAMTRLIQRLHNIYPENIYESPTAIFAIVGLFAQMGYVVWHTYSYLFKENVLRNLLSRKRVSVNGFKTRAKSTIFPLLLIFVVSLSLVWRFIRESPSSNVSIASRYIVDCIQSTFEGDIMTNISSKPCNLIKFVKSIGQISILLCGMLSVNCFEIFVLLMIVSGYELTRGLAIYSENLLKRSIHNPRSINVSDVNCILKVVEELHEFFCELNKFGSGFFIRVFCLMVPWISYRLLDSLPGVTSSVFADMIYNWAFFFLYGSILMLAAEIKKQGDLFRDNIITVLYKIAIDLNCERLTQTSSTIMSAYIQHAVKDVCLKGGPFFNFSYGFIGSGKHQYAPQLLSQCMPVFIVSLAVCSQWSLWQLDYFYPFIVPFDRLNFPPSCCNEGDIFLSLVKAVLMVQGELMYCGAWYFVFIITVTGYRVTKQGVENSNIDNKISPGITGKYNMGSLFHTVHYLQQYFKDLNSIGCESYLAVYCAVIPWASFRLMTTLPGVAVTGGNGLLVRKFFYWIVFLYNATFLCLAAEAKRTVEQFRDNVISRIIENDIGHLTAVHTSQTRCLTWIKYVKHQLKDVCFHGGPFFNISYAFLGTTIGIVITFTLFQLQFGKSTEGFSLEV